MGAGWRGELGIYPPLANGFLEKIKTEVES
jgi:hypothetical protein